MSEDQRRRTAYEHALVRLFPGWTHESRSHLANISTNLEVIAELMAKHASEGDPAVASLSTWLQRARKGVQHLTAALARQVAAARLESSGPIDLAEELRRIQALVAQSAMDRSVRFTVEAPATPVWAAGGAEIAEALTIAVVELIFATPPSPELQIRLAVAGDRAVLDFDGSVRRPDESPWLEPVRDAFTAGGGAVRSAPASELQFTLPLATVPR